MSDKRTFVVFLPNGTHTMREATQDYVTAIVEVTSRTLLAEHVLPGRALDARQAAKEAVREADVCAANGEHMLASAYRDVAMQHTMAAHQYDEKIQRYQREGGYEYVVVGYRTDEAAATAEAMRMGRSHVGPERFATYYTLMDVQRVPDGMTVKQFVNDRATVEV